MSGDIITLDSHAFLNDKKLNTKYLNPDCTYLAILNQESNPLWQWELMKGGAKEIKVLFESKMAINRTPNHGIGPRNTLFIFEISEEYKPKILEAREKYAIDKKEAFPKFLELCKLVETSNWNGFSTEARNRRLEFNKLCAEYGFSYYDDYKYPKRK
jgi:hypothetical protein